MKILEIRKRPHVSASKAGKTLILAVLATILLLGPGLTNTQVATQGGTWYVDGTLGTDDATHGVGPGAAAFKTIQYAINYAGVGTGDTVNVAAGIYDEQVVIDKSLTVQGEGETTVVKPSSAAKLTQVFDGLFWYGSPSTKKIAGVIVANVPDGSSVTVKNLKVDESSVTSRPAGADYLAGIFYRETGGVLDLVSVVGGGSWSGYDRAYGMYLSAATNIVSVEVKGSTIASYDKNGIEAMGDKLTINVHHNTITGRGPTLSGDEVQNGVHVGREAVGTVDYNTISDLAYQPEQWWAAGIMFYSYVSPTGKSATAIGNTVTDCQIGIIFKNVNALAQDNTVSGGTVGLIGIYAEPNYAGTYTASFVGNTVSGAKDDSYYHDENAAIGANTYATLTPGTGASLAVTMRNNQLTGVPPYTADGVYAGGDAGSVTATISDNFISGWNHGINLASSSVAGATITGNTIQSNVGTGSGVHVEAAVDATKVHVNFNNIVDNSGSGVFGVSNGGTGTLDAESNWWGSATGPTHSTNIGGTGDAVTDNVDFTPWLLGPWPAEVWVSTTGDDSNPGTLAEPFKTIQKGVDTVAIGGIVHVMAGTYTATSLASIVITKPLTLSGEDKLTTIIDAGAWGTSGAGWPKGIHSYADNVVIEKFTIRGFQGDGVNTGGYGVVFRDFGHDDEKQGETYIYYQNAVLRDAIIEDCYSSVYALVHQHLTVEAVTITDSLADGIFIARYSDYATVNGSTVMNSGDHGIWVGYCWKALGPSNHAVITNNFVDGAREGGISFVASHDALIEGNTVTNVKGEEPEVTGGWSRGAISLKDGVSDVVVRNNEVYGNDGMGTGSGRGLGIDGTSSNVQVSGNTIRDNAGGGIKVIGLVTGWTCNFNNIYGNTGFGAENTIGSVLNFKNNWWGDATGPHHATSNPSGLGNKVSDNVDFAEWLGGASTTQTVTDGVVDAKGTAGTEVQVTGTATVDVAKYAQNPGGTPAFSALGSYVDVHIGDVSAVTEVTIRVYYTAADVIGHVESQLRLYWWDGAAWIECSNTGVFYPLDPATGYRGYIWATITDTTTPNLGQLTGAPFGGGNPGQGMLRLRQPDTAVQTTISLDGKVRNDWGLDWVKLSEGNYVLTFSDVPGWAKPTQVRVLVYSYGSLSPESDSMVDYLVDPIPVYDGKVTEVMASFTQLGYLHVITDPAVAGTIYVDGVPVNDWGCWVPLAPGTYTVSFGDVPGYTKPGDQTVVVNAGTTVVVTGTYST